MTSVSIILALLIDKWLAEPKEFHPLVLFGDFANRLESIFNRGKQKRIKGLVAMLIAIGPIALVAYWCQQLISNYWLIKVLLSAFVLYLSIGWQSLLQHAQAVQEPLATGDYQRASEALAMIVSRDTAGLTPSETAKAATESVLENGADAVFSAIFWFIVGGLSGVVIYRLANTLDAMWGYKNTRFLHFGWASARLDDLLNYVPARLTALTYACAGQTAQAMACWKSQAKSWKSPNAGPVMAAGAGAINVSLGGEAIYHGEPQWRPLLGPEPSPDTSANANSIVKAMTLVSSGVYGWGIIALILAVVA